MPKVLVDFSQTVIAACAAQPEVIKAFDHPDDVIKQMVINMILGLRNRFGGDIIIVCDGDNYWRKEEFEWYKGHRDKIRDNDFLPWDLIRETIDEMISDLTHHFPYKVVKVDGAEADDIIAVLCQYFQDNELVHSGLIYEPDKVTIVSTDSDFKQLQKFRNVAQWNNVQKKMIACDNPKKYLIEHIFAGDDGDNIPSIANGDDWAKCRAQGIPNRAKPLKQARMLDFYNKGPHACLNEAELIHWRRNEKLIDFDFIPENLAMKIINDYTKCEILGSKSKVYKYLVDHRMKRFLSSASSF